MPKQLNFINNKGVRKMEVEITNKNMSVVNAKKSMQFDCPNCKYNQIKVAWNYVHNYCPHCGAKIIWDTDPEPTKLF